MSQNQISKKAYDELAGQLNQLKTVKRKAIVKAIGEAREHGDLKENSAYHSAKQEQSLNEAKIAQLEAKLDAAEIVEMDERPKGVVSLGSTVKYQDLESDQIREYTIVSELEANIREKKISSTTPVGNGLLGCKKGEVVEITAPAGVMKYKILEIT